MKVPCFPRRSARCLTSDVSTAVKSSNGLEVLNLIANVLMHPAVVGPQCSGEHRQVHFRRRRWGNPKLCRFAPRCSRHSSCWTIAIFTPGEVLAVFGFSAGLHGSDFGGSQGTCVEALRSTQHFHIHATDS